jgi:predicted transposase/invertase (TIGR01784 family)
MAKPKKFSMTHDVFIKRSMLNLEVATEFFSANLPKSILKIVDLSTLKPEKADFVDAVLGNGVVDILYSVQWDNKLGYISLLLEHQSTPDPLMVFRIQKYMLRLCDAHLAKYPKSKLPCIYPIILYSGKTKYTSPLSFWELFSKPKLAKQCFTDPIYLLELRTIKDIDLKHRYHSGIVLSLMREIHRKNIFPYLHAIQPLLQLIGKENLHFLEDLLRYILCNGGAKNKEDIIQLFATTVSKQDKGKIMSIANEFREEARREIMEQVVHNMLSRNMSLDTISEITRLSLREIRTLQRKSH